MENNEAEQRRLSDINYSKSSMADGKALIRDLDVRKGASATAILRKLGLYSRRYTPAQMKYLSLEARKPMQRNTAASNKEFVCTHYAKEFPILS